MKNLDVVDDVIYFKWRVASIWRKYDDNIDETDWDAVYRRGRFLGIYEQLVRILHRNTKNISEDYKNTDFFRLALVTYVDLYCRIIVRDNFIEGEEDVGVMALCEYYDRDYEAMAKLPNSAYVSEEVNPEIWIRYMRDEISYFGVRNLALLDVMNALYYQEKGELVKFLPAEEYKVFVL